MTKTTQVEDFVVTDRGGIVENRHGVHAAVVDAEGKLLYSVGNPARMTLARSAAKPAQALAILETPGFDRFKFDEADLGLMCASHNSEERHIARARSMLAKVGANESDLRCGGHPSICPNVNRTWIKADFEPTGVYNNCSGKHAGMLGGGLALGAGFSDYHLSTHPIQVKVKKVVEDLSGLSEEEVKWGIDGCNLPAPGLPLSSMGRIFAGFAEAADTAARDFESASDRTAYMARIFNAMAKHPEMVGGEGRFCTVLMETFGGALIGKVGADGCYGVGIRESEYTNQLGAEGAVGIAVKIEDGSLEILYAVVAEILEQLQVGTTEMRERLAAFHHLKRLNTMGVETGQVSLAFKVKNI
ncbi:l-asparaginase ii [Colletotrichum truncatum]|uniref:L-asparaginase ii n=1 Tax=Colletotrichum truncatum TaxID=5467 RepID=A0ACC3YKQ5_COLTU|nr:l-asparaginase ii [Colletotrichum truncatum]KAF6798288.1 l-asparaginase ii [Colletotrichum truncatum]